MRPQAYDHEMRRWDRGGRIALTILFVMITSAGMSSCSQGCGDKAAFNGAIFVATITGVTDDGAATLHIESVELVSDLGTIPRPPVFGVTTPATASSSFVGIASGKTVTVDFPKAQVDHLRRDVGKQYRVVAYPSADGSGLSAEVQDIDSPCGETRFKDT